MDGDSPAPGKGRIIIISGPAGVGKTTICDRLVEELPSLKRLVTTTSRSTRPGEVNGVDYHFVSPRAFEDLIRRNQLIEWARVHGRYYGSQRRHVEQAIAEGCDLILNIDVQGAETFRKELAAQLPKGVSMLSVFIRPASLAQIEERLRQRGSDDEDEIQRRLNTARKELEMVGEFDHAITSSSREEDLRRIKDILHR